MSPAIRVAQRIDDGGYEARVVAGNGVILIWAPEGPGWPRTGTDWFEAQQVCFHLSKSGLELESEPQHQWRLPTVDEAILHHRLRWASLAQSKRTES